MAEVVPTANADMMPSAVCSKQHARERQSVRVRSTLQNTQAGKRNRSRATYNSASGNGKAAHICAFVRRLTNTCSTRKMSRIALLTKERFNGPSACARTGDGCAVVGGQKSGPVVKRKWRPALGSDVVFDAAGSGIDANEVGVCWREPL